MKQVFMMCLCIFVLCSVVSAQVDWMPDRALRDAVREALGLPPAVPLTQDKLLSLNNLNAWDRNITDLTGLEYATNLRNLGACGNKISDLTPLANLMHLEYLSLCGNEIFDVSLLANLIHLKGLDLGGNKVSDITPLKNLIELEWINLGSNPVENIEILANFKNLTHVRLDDTFVSDFTPLSGLTLIELIPAVTDLITMPDEICLPIVDRVENRTFPSVNLWPQVGTLEEVARYDFIWSHGAWYIRNNIPLRKVEHRRLREMNPNILIMFAILIQTAADDDFPADSPVWLRDAHGERVFYYEGRWGGWREYQLDIVNPLAQDLIVEWILEKVDCQIYDGLAIDGLAHNGLGFVGRHLHPGTDAEIVQGITRILQKIRANVPEDFLIIGNARSKNNLYADYINGDAMEVGPGADGQGGYTHEQLQLFDDILLWNEKHLRFPQVNWSEGLLIESEPSDSPNNLRWVRVFTVRSMTHADGYVSIHHEPTHLANETEIWYPFWDADLGRPVGGDATKGVLYETPESVAIEGLFIREFTNGWVVYNRSGEERRVYLPEKVTGWHSGVENRHWHVLPDLDGEIYLKAGLQNPPTVDVNGDGIVNILDLVAVANAFGKNAPDVNGDRVVNVLDLVAVANAFGQ